MAAPVITPNGAVVGGKQTRQFTANQAVTWTASGGTITAGGLFTAPNVSGNYSVTARNDGNETSSVLVGVTAICPVVPSWSYSGDYDKNFLQFIPESGAADRETRSKGDYKYTIEITANSRQKAQFLEFLAFHAAHYGTTKNFYFDHPDTATRYLMYFDAKLKEQWAGANLVSYSTVMKQV